MLERGAQTLYDEVIETLRSLEGNEDGKGRLVDLVLDILESHARNVHNMLRGRDVRNMLMDLRKSDQYWRNAERFQRALTKSE